MPRKYKGHVREIQRNVKEMQGTCEGHAYTVALITLKSLVHLRV